MKPSAPRSTSALLLPLLPLLLSACQSEVDGEEKAYFVLANNSGQALTLTVFDTQRRAPAPLLVAVPAGGRVERVAYGGAGAIVAPELALHGDSVRVVFADGKQALYHCPRLAQGNLQCVPDDGLLSLSAYHREPISRNVNRWTYTITPADYARAQ